jgi:hypothetical protein
MDMTIGVLSQGQELLTIRLDFGIAGIPYG